MAIGPEETTWIRDEFPLAPTFLTSARTGQAVEDAFTTLVSRTVDAVLATDRKSQNARLVRQRILLFLSEREARGASKNELFMGLKQVEPAQIMEELDHLVRLEAVSVEESVPGTFVKSADVAPTSRYRATVRGKRIATSPRDEALLIEEIV